LERAMGVEPTTSPWKGDVLPLYYARKIVAKFISEWFAGLGNAVCDDASPTYFILYFECRFLKSDLHLFNKFDKKYLV
jgi:hypothetical protein